MPAARSQSPTFDALAHTKQFKTGTRKIRQWTTERRQNNSSQSRRHRATRREQPEAEQWHLHTETEQEAYKPIAKNHFKNFARAFLEHTHTCTARKVFLIANQQQNHLKSFVCHFVLILRHFVAPFARKRCLLVTEASKQGCTTEIVYHLRHASA